MSPITEEELKNPHIKFFAETNPGWYKVYQLHMSVSCVVLVLYWYSYVAGIFMYVYYSVACLPLGLLYNWKMTFFSNFANNRRLFAKNFSVKIEGHSSILFMKINVTVNQFMQIFSHKNSLYMVSCGYMYLWRLN